MTSLFRKESLRCRKKRLFSTAREQERCCYETRNSLLLLFHCHQDLRGMSTILEVWVAERGPRNTKRAGLGCAPHITNTCYSDRNWNIVRSCGHFVCQLIRVILRPVHLDRCSDRTMRRLIIAFLCADTLYWQTATHRRS